MAADQKRAAASRSELQSMISEDRRLRCMPEV